jgi:UDP-N-acetylmuramoyl-L-alanyl-D-glutamate--2,6-diaminopimelate ligase
MLLSRLIEGLEIFELSGNLNVEVKDIAYDSRKVTKGSVFICIEGFKEDGHQYVEKAIQNGAIAIVASKKLDIQENIALIYVDETREAMSFLADKFFHHPSKMFSLVGVTGTKGKTTITYMIRSVLEHCGTKVGLIGTIENRIGQKVIPTERTTPESVDLQGLFSEMLKESVSHCVMEVSSHALELKRVKYIDFKVGIFTNLSRDHMDFHKTFDHYLAAKMKLFDLCEVGVINIDTEYGQEVAKKANCKVFTVGIHNHADIRAKNILQHKDRVEFDVISEKYNGHIDIHIPGIFTVYNALCAIGACMVLGLDFEEVKKGLFHTKVPGRAQVVDIQKDYTVMIDYAHTPDSLENILKLVKEFTKGRLISVFGCGGDRDRTKRPIMGKISGSIADFTIITSDNPRSEEPNSIIQEIENGLKETVGQYITIEDRRMAIKHAMIHAKKDDVILIAGKGHETYQILANGKIDFDEQKVVQEISKEI